MSLPVTSPWHAGELAMQARVGAVAQLDLPGRQFIRPFLLDQHRDFYAQLPFVVLGSVDRQGDAWATVRAGAPGFLRSPDARTLRVVTPRDPADPAEAGFGDDHAVGLLGIDPSTRRRNRLNGRVRRTADDRFDIEVAQSFGNCPRYIQVRASVFVREPHLPTPAPVIESTALDAAARALISQADTFYVASYIDDPDRATRQVDASHRGGPPGFVRIEPDGTLTIPDFAGNRFFMTLGNFLVNPRAGLLFIDFATGEMLQMSGEARVVSEVPDSASFAGAERWWTFAPRRIVRRPDALPLRWQRAPG